MQSVQRPNDSQLAQRFDPRERGTFCPVSVGAVLGERSRLREKTVRT
jgi:hypothetical protein